MTRLLILLFASSSLLAQRYLDSTFIPVQTHTNQVYATAPQLNSPWTDENNTSNVDLTMHIFQPQDDVAELRPAILMVHSGAFVSGEKEADDMMRFCKNLAGKGYVTATMDYRLGMNSLSTVSGERAVYRGIQDGRAAIRYLKSISTVLKIDTSNIFMLGSSAGSFIALHNLFMNEESERPDGTFAVNYDKPPYAEIPDLGTLDAIAPTLNDGKGSHPKAIVSLWGALQDTTLILSRDLEYPVCLIHGTADGTVPFGVGSPFGWGGFPPTYGSSPISERFDNLDFSYESYFPAGQDHEFYGCYNGNWSEAFPINEYWDTVLTKVTNFFYSNLSASYLPVELTEFKYEIVDQKVYLFWNTATEVNNYGFEIQRLNYMPYVVESNAWKKIGFVNGHGNSNSPKSYSFIDDTPPCGKVKYRLKQIDFDGKYEYSSVIDINIETPVKSRLIQNYPNPFNPETAISFQLSAVSHVSLKVFDNLGRVVATLVNEEKPAGKYTITFNAKNLPSGVYFCRFRAGNFSDTKKLVLLK